MRETKSFRGGVTKSLSARPNPANAERFAVQIIFVLLAIATAVIWVA